jgi:hypothetical protein
MKVKVNYTVDIEDIPAMIQEILTSIRRDISDCTTRLIFNPSNFDKMVEDYRSAREKLDVVDSQIEDIINITAGWLQATQPKIEEGEEEMHHEE